MSIRSSVKVCSHRSRAAAPSAAARPRLAGQIPQEPAEGGAVSGLEEKPGLPLHDRLRQAGEPRAHRGGAAGGRFENHERHALLGGGRHHQYVECAVVVAESRLEPDEPKAAIEILCPLLELGRRPAHQHSAHSRSRHVQSLEEHVIALLRHGASGHHPREQRPVAAEVLPHLRRTSSAGRGGHPVAKKVLEPRRHPTAFRKSSRDRMGRADHGVDARPCRLVGQNLLTSRARPGGRVRGDYPPRHPRKTRGEGGEHRQVRSGPAAVVDMQHVRAQPTQPADHGSQLAGQSRRAGGLARCVVERVGEGSLHPHTRRLPRHELHQFRLRRENHGLVAGLDHSTREIHKVALCPAQLPRLGDVGDPHRGDGK